MRSVTTLFVKNVVGWETRAAAAPGYDVTDGADDHTKIVL